jgi:hypothetical protein
MSTMRAAPTIAQMLSEVSVTGVAGASAAGSGWLPNSELLLLPFELPLPFDEPPVLGAWSLLVLDESELELSPPPELSVPPEHDGSLHELSLLPEVSVPPELSVLPELPELSVPPEQEGSVHEVSPPPEVSLPPEVSEPPDVSGPGWNSEFWLGAA